MTLITLEGDHFQMGVQHGRQLLGLRPLVLDDLDRRLAGLEGPRSAGLFRKVEEVWARRAPSTLDMLAGIAASLELDAVRLRHYALASYVDDRLGMSSAVEGCTVWAAAGPATAGGAPMLAKNRDYRLAHAALQTVARAVPQDGYRHLYVTSAGSPAVFSSGINEMGLAVADTHVASTDIGPGLARYTLMMELLEHHASVRAALTYLRRAVRMGGGNLILLDDRGEMAVFETGHRTWGVVRARDHLVAATNHFVTPPLRGSYRGRDAGGPDGESASRLRSVDSRLREFRGCLDIDQARRIMASHVDDRAAICRHDLDDASGTISSAIFLPAERSLLFCSGRPCESGHTRYTL
jgi:isopenicillin-N N-acyltransferase-like protein